MLYFAYQIERNMTTQMEQEEEYQRWLQDVADDIKEEYDYFGEDFYE